MAGSRGGVCVTRCEMPHFPRGVADRERRLLRVLTDDTRPVLEFQSF